MLSLPTTATWNPPCSSLTARWGTRIAPFFTSVMARTLAYCPGRSRLPGLGKTATVPMVPVLTSTCRSEKSRCPLCGKTEPSARISSRSSSRAEGACRSRSCKAQVLLLAERIEDADRIALRDHGEHRRGADQIAHLGLGGAGDAADRRGDAAPAEVEAGLMHGGLPGVHHRLGGGRGRQRVVELLLADRLLRGQGAEAVDVLLRLGPLGLGLRQIPLRRLELRLSLPGVDLEHQLPPVDEAPLGIDPPQQIPLGLRPDLGVDVPLRRADPLLKDRHVPLDDRSDHHRRGRRRGRRSLLAMASSRHGEDDPQSSNR